MALTVMRHLAHRLMAYESQSWDQADTSHFVGLDMLIILEKASLKTPMSHSWPPRLFSAVSLSPAMIPGVSRGAGGDGLCLCEVDGKCVMPRRV